MMLKIFKKTVLLVIISALPVALTGSAFAGIRNFSDQRIVELEAISADLSGITYSPDAQRFYTIEDSNTDGAQLKEFDLNFVYMRNIVLDVKKKHQDFEDIVYLGNNRFALVNEANEILLTQIDTTTESITIKDMVQIQLPSPKKKNKGLEAACYSSAGNGTLFVFQEAKPMQVFAFSGVHSAFSDRPSWTQFEPFDADAQLGDWITDISACTIDPTSGNFLILSHESSRIVELTPQGAYIEHRDLPKKDGGYRLTQYEGLTFDAEGNLLVTSEPNLIRILKKS